jgi:hypothetical protein
MFQHPQFPNFLGGLYKASLIVRSMLHDQLNGEERNGTTGERRKFPKLWDSAQLSGGGELSS